jgi:hypothetical protein
MTTIHDRKELTTVAEVENARVGYQAAVNLWIYEGSQIWSKFTAMIYANTIVLATIGIVITSSRAGDLGLLRIALGILGLVLCLSWILLTKRSFEYYNYWIFSSRELEENYLSDSVRTVSRGAVFADGQPVSFQTKPPIHHQASAKLPNIRIQTISYIIIAVFMGLYVVTFFQH